MGIPSRPLRKVGFLTALAMGGATLVFAFWPGAAQAVPAASGASYPWWVWVVILFFFSFFLGIVSLLGGMGGGTLFVSVASSFFPFHLDFVRCAGLLVALSGALSAGPGLLRYGMGDLRLSMPAALMTSTGAIAGALTGLRVPAHLVQTALGVTILGILVIMVKARRTDYPEVREADPLARFLGIRGLYFDRATQKEVAWQVHRTLPGLALFLGIGFLAGLFGIGAGWANVTVLNLLMGVPLKVAVGTSKLIIAVTDTSAAWIFLNSGAVLPLIVVPSILGIMLGSWMGVGILLRTSPVRLKYIVMVLLAFAGVRSLLRGLGLW